MRANKGLEGSKVVVESGRAHHHDLFFGCRVCGRDQSKKKLLDSKVDQGKKTYHCIYITHSSIEQAVVTDSDSKELVADAELGPKSVLHTSLTTRNGKTEGNRDIVDNIF